jgi:hypothetical protein
MLMVIGVIVTMFAMGSFAAKPAHAIGVVGTTVTPATAKSIGQYTIVVTGAVGGSTGVSAIPVGGTITVTFGSKFTVPSAIATTDIKLKATVLAGGGSAGRLNNAEAVTIDGRAVTITVPDMDKTAGNGDQSIAVSTGLIGSAVTITFTQAAGIENPEVKQDAQIASGTTGTLTVKSSADTTAITSTLTAITAFSKFSPTTAARAATLTVTGGGFNATCDDCKIRLSPQSGTAPTTGTGGVAFNGSGTIDASGVFAGTILLSSTTKAGGYVWITDSAGEDRVSSTAFVQKAGATPRSTSSKPGSVVSVDLVDYTGDATLSTSTSTTIGGVAVTSSNVTTIPASGSTATLTPFKFTVPTSMGIGTHKVIITESGGTTKSANFMLTLGLRSVTVVPATAVPGQSITLSGTGFTKNGTIEGSTDGGSTNKLTARAGSNTTDAYVNWAASQDISIDSLGSWSYTTKMPSLQAFSSQSSNKVVFTAEDTAGLVGVSDTAFARTAKAVTLSPTTISPGGALTITVAGFTVDTGEVAAYNAEFTVTMGTSNGGSEITLTGTSVFPIGADGSGTGTVTVPTTVVAGTKYITVTDNAAELTADTSTDATTNRTKTVSVTVPKGTITVDPIEAPTGSTVTLTGSNFPPATTASTLTVGGASAMPTGGILTDASGGFTAIVEIPAATAGGSLSPGTQIVSATVGQITGSSTTFSTPNPTITITPSSAAVEEDVVITGTGFNSLGTVSTLTIGSASALPSPAPRAARNGDLETTVTIPLLNVGSYTVVVTNASGFSASATFTATAAKVVAASTADDTATVFADVIANDDSLVRVWRFSNADQSWNFYDPRPAFASANTLVKTGAGDIVWVNVTAEQTFQGGTLFPGWNLISLN